MKIFLDVGSHRGQTLKEVIKPCYRFDIIHCFDPMPREFQYLIKKYKKRRSCEKVIFHNKGLLDQTKELIIHGSNKDMGATIFDSKPHLNGKEINTVCMFQRVSDFFKQNIKENDLVLMKLNVEGSECIIMNDLLDTKECFKIDNVMIDFDVRRVPGQEHEEQLLKDRMKKEGFYNYSLCDDVMIGSTHRKRIRHWLSGLDFAEDFMNIER